MLLSNDNKSRAAAFVDNEVVDELFFRKRDGILCKLDMKKVYDHVNW